MTVLDGNVGEGHQPSKSNLGLPDLYDLVDISPFNPSAAIYFMDGYSDATFKLHGSAEEITLAFTDRNTSIAASSPLVYSDIAVRRGIFVPAPRPLNPVSYVPKNTPDRYKQETTTHLMQVISMNMRENKSSSRLLIGLPYAEKYPELFFRPDIFDDGKTAASSHGIVQSITSRVDSQTGTREAITNGYPARSFFAIYHILETKVGTFFNKKPSMMELQPGENGKLALTLPPMPFNYALINGPIPLYDVSNPDGTPVGELIAAHHRDTAPASLATVDSWPWHLPELDRFPRTWGA